MKKILTIALCLSAVGAMNAQKATVDQAAKLSGKLDKISEARSLINEAMSNPETANDARTYYVAGKIEFDAFNDAFTKRAINPNDPAIDLLAMGNQLVAGYNLYMKALPLDSVPNEKGQVKPKFSKNMVSKINSHHNDYFQYGGEMYNNKHYYPEAYNAFMIYGDIPGYSWADKNVKAVPDTTLALAYYYAGISAYSGNALDDAAKALQKARNKGIKESQAYVYEIACWQNIAQRDSTKEELAQSKIFEIAKDGYERFGLEKPLFLNSLVQTLVDNKEYDNAVSLVGAEIGKNSENPMLYTLRAWILDRKGDEAAALADYRKSATFENADVETLVRAARKIYNAGTVVYNAIEGNQPEARNNVKVNYFEQAKAIAERADSLDPGNPDVQNILESVNYALTTYF